MLTKGSVVTIACNRKAGQSKNANITPQKLYISPHGPTSRCQCGQIRVYWVHNATTEIRRCRPCPEKCRLVRGTQVTQRFHSRAAEDDSDRLHPLSCNEVITQMTNEGGTTKAFASRPSPDGWCFFVAKRLGYGCCPAYTLHRRALRAGRLLGHYQAQTHRRQGHHPRRQRRHPAGAAPRRPIRLDPARRRRHPA